MKTYEFSLFPLKPIPGKPHWFEVPTVTAEGETIAEAEAKAQTMLEEGQTIWGRVIEVTPELVELRKKMGI